MDTARILKAHAAEVVEQSVEAVLGSKHTRYAAAGQDVLRSRLSGLFDVVVAGVEARDATPTVAKARAIAVDRFAEGFELQDVQCAINYLEAAIWRLLARELPPDRFAERIRTVSTILGLAKDALARRYVALASGLHVPSIDTAALFRGTDGA